MLSKSKAKHCDLDPIPTWLVKKLTNQLTPVITSICNASMESCRLPTNQKCAIVRPILKKPSLDASELNSYRPISNLSFLSKMIERCVATRYVDHAERQHLFPARQSAYRKHHSTETTVVSVLNDVISAADHGQVTALVLLDLSSAFDCVNHEIMIRVLNERFQVEGQALAWFLSYLGDRSQIFRVDGRDSVPFPVDCSVPQGSCLGPVEFISYTEDVVELMERHRVHNHLFADDKQLYISAPVTEVQATLRRLSDCITDVISWCASRRLQLNVLKTELMWIGTRQRLQQLSGVDITLMVGSDVIKPVHVVRDLGVHIDDELTMKQHVGKVAGACFYHLRRLRQIRRHVSNVLMAQLIYAFVTSRLDYCNSVLACLPACTIAPLQRVQNAAARLLLNRRKTDHITDGLKD